MRRLVTSELIADVRSLTDEENTVSVKDVQDIIPALNRAQDIASNILARHYESPLLTYTLVNLTPDVQEYDIPSDAFEQRLEKVEIKVNSFFTEVERLSYRDITYYESSLKTSYPYYYSVIGTKYRLLPNINAAYPLRIWYLKDPDPLVMEQGRITAINQNSNYLVVDSIGEDLTTDSSELNSFVNIIDGNTGAVRVSLQIQSIVGNKITFKSSPSRDEVLGKTISSAIPDAVTKDDYVCVVSGTCISLLKKPFSNYLIQLAVADITRKLGGNLDMELAIKKEMEELVTRSWVGREQTLKVKASSSNWAYSRRRPFITNSGN